MNKPVGHYNSVSRYGEEDATPTADLARVSCPGGSISLGHPNGSVYSERSCSLGRPSASSLPAQALPDESAETELCR